MTKPNRLSRLFTRCKSLPAPLQSFAMSFLFGSAVKFFATARIRITEAEHGRVIMVIRNRRKVQNHIKGVHATAMALLAESATGLVLGMSLPDDKLPLMKTMKVNYVKRAQGDLKAIATLSPEQLRAIENDERGDIVIAVTVTDSEGNEPLQAEMLWAWRPKKAS
ncbi:DUF4442 domain-containing protein [Permianibacter sp. IMCC34836]|uniref:DUF4442 domain-containing protein n=1 Tax=Permianibacter fluminis TaxID=2738515 RepID=UPI001557EB38|nr:DUF4442 domain-containing protein [Permianibacter fluminis]NQD38240.1 DUF4442 domain-containing protein [Permianibacter fluminis]